YMVKLKGLHDELPPMDEKTMQGVFDRAFEKDPFYHFEKAPIASASIGQVHEAWLDKETKVAVKLRHQDIEKQVKADIYIVMFFNSLFKPLFSHHTKHSIEAVISEFSDMIRKEVSLNQERANLIKFSETYEDMDVSFPKPYAQFSSDDALVMSFEEGFRFDDKKALTTHNIDIIPLIETLVIFYTEQMLVKGFFHADPHPGNLLVSKEGKLILLDFGMVKRVPNHTRIAIIELIKAANEQDFERFVGASKRLGVVAYDAPVAELAEFTQRMFDIFNNDALDSASMQDLAFDVLDQTRNLPFKLPQEAIYILRVSAIIEGLGTTYIENFNGVKDILPILQENIPRALGAKESILETIVDEFKNLPLDVRAFRNALYRISEENLVVEISNAQLEVVEKSLRESLTPIITGIVLILSSLFVLMYNHTLENYALVLFGAGVLRLLFRKG
ncbi:MAG: AarF/ABC1/UbiB kinase family protein, partial [Campylobacterota bacterium]|nr:AarF/ABC1/UbiB kinase family protein [Campylobacterota bacterium]